MIFILGGRGFVGSAYVRICEKSGLEYRIIDRTNYETCIGSSCDVLINAAGNSKKFFSQQDPTADFDLSVRSVRASLVDFRFKTYVLISSADVYPDSTSPATTSESQSLDVSKMSPYGFHKHLAELCVCHAADRWLIFRCGGFVGPLLKKNPIYDILHGGPIWLAPESELQYISTDDAARIAMEFVNRETCGEILNLCGLGTIRLSDVMRWANRSVGVQPDSRVFRCELNLSKTSAFVTLPRSEDAVKTFVEKENQSKQNIERLQL